MEIIQPDRAIRGRFAKGVSGNRCREAGVTSCGEGDHGPGSRALTIGNKFGYKRVKVAIKAPSPSMKKHLVRNDR